MPYSFCLPPVECCRGTTPTPSREVAAATKSRAIADGRHGGRRNQRAEARDLPQLPAAGVIITYVLNLVGDRLDIGLDLLPLLPHAIQQPAQARAQILFGIFNESREVLPQVNGLSRKGDAAFQQESSNLVDQRGAAPSPISLGKSSLT